MIGLPSEEKVRAAATWLSEQNPVPPHVVNVIKTKFDLKALEACEACKLANEFRRAALNG
ncbi:arsenate reductase-like glutaredoxin family protein [Sinorhizobium fredii]